MSGKVALTDRIWRLIATLLVVAAVIPFAGRQPVAAREALQDDGFTSAIFDYGLEWEAPWGPVEGSYTAANDDTYEAFSLTDGTSAIRVELADFGMSVADLADTAVQGTSKDKKNLRDLGGGSTDEYFVYLLEFDAELDNGDTVRARAFIEMSDLSGGTLRDGRPVQVLTLLSPVDGLVDAAENAQESIVRDDGGPLFVSDPVESLKAVEAARAPATPGKPGVDGNVYTSRTLGYAFSWNENIWDWQDSGSDDYDNLLLTNDDGNSITISGGKTDVDDLEQCLQAESELLQDPDDNAVDFVRVDRGFTLPVTNLDGEWVAWQYHVFWDADIEYDLLTYIECRYLEEAGGMIIVELTAEIEDWEGEVPFFEAVLATLNLGPDAPEPDQPEDDETPEPSADGADAFEFASAAVSISWDSGIWSTDTSTDDATGAEFLFLTSETTSIVLLLFPDETGDAGQCIDDAVTSLEEDEGAIDIRSARRFDEPEWKDAEETDFVTFVLQFDGGTDLNGVAWFACAAVDDHMLLIRAAASQEEWDDAVPEIDDILAAIEF